MPSTTNNRKDEITFVRNKKYGTVSIASNGWTKEVCNVTWNGRSPKLDIREWDSEYNKMSKGLTFTKEEAKKVLKILASVNFEEFDVYERNNEIPISEDQPVNESVNEVESADIQKDTMLDEAEAEDGLTDETN